MEEEENKKKLPRDEYRNITSHITLRGKDDTRYSPHPPPQAPKHTKPQRQKKTSYSYLNE